MSYRRLCTLCFIISKKVILFRLKILKISQNKKAKAYKLTYYNKTETRTDATQGSEQLKSPQRRYGQGWGQFFCWERHNICMGRYKRRTRNGLNYICYIKFP